MNKSLLRNAWLPAILAGGFIVLDLVADRLLGETRRLDLAHLILGSAVLLISSFLLHRAVVTRHRAEATLLQALNELDAQVRQRKAELEQANEALRAEIAERREVEQALRTSDETARALMNASGESAVLLDPQGIVLAANETAARRLGVTVAQMVGASLFDFFPPEVAASRRRYLDAIFQMNEPLHFVDQRADRMFSNQVYPVRDSHGQIIRLAVFGEDITERMRMDSALRASEEKYRLLFQNMAEGFALYELLYNEEGQAVDWRVLEVNNAYTHHTGVAREQIVGRRISELFPEAVVEYLPRFTAVVETQTSNEFETYATAVGRYQRVVTFPAGGRRFANTIEDITKRKQSENQLRQAQAELALDLQKRSALEERQRLARELHDSVSQALYGISLGANTALALFETDRQQVREALAYILGLAHAGLTEMRALIFELRPESLEQEGLVAALTKQVAALRTRHDVQVSLTMCAEPAMPGPLKEALYRIAREALQNAVKHARANQLNIQLLCDPEATLLEVSDDGIGFDPQMPYPGHLGLQSMRERAASFGGTVEILSAPGQGTRVQARIPASLHAQEG